MTAGQKKSVENEVWAFSRAVGVATISYFWGLLKYLEKKQFLVQGRNGAETV